MPVRLRVTSSSYVLFALWHESRTNSQRMLPLTWAYPLNNRTRAMAQGGPVPLFKLFMCGPSPCVEGQEFCLSQVRANSLVCTMPCHTFMGACVNTAVHMYDSSVHSVRDHSRLFWIEAVSPPCDEGSRPCLLSQVRRKRRFLMTRWIERLTDLRCYG